MLELEPHDYYNIYDRELAKKVEGYPNCDCCNEPLLEEYYQVFGYNICESCINDCKKSADYEDFDYDSDYEEYKLGGNKNE